MLILVVTATHYFSLTPQVDLLSKILWVLAVAAATIVVLIGVLALWLKIWLGKYW